MWKLKSSNVIFELLLFCVRILESKNDTMIYNKSPILICIKPMRDICQHLRFVPNWKPLKSRCSVLKIKTFLSNWFLYLAAFLNSYFQSINLSTAFKIQHPKQYGKDECTTCAISMLLFAPSLVHGDYELCQYFGSSSTWNQGYKNSFHLL